jgi:hypothetical protein
MTDAKMPVSTGTAADILAKTKPQVSAPIPEPEPEQEQFPLYQLPVTPCTISLCGKRKTFADGVARATNAAEQAELASMAEAGNISLAVISGAGQFTGLPKRTVLA